MEAAIHRRYGPPHVVGIEDIAPPEVGPRQVLVRVHATAVTSGDARIRGADFPPGFGSVARLVFGIRRPRRPVLGGIVSGVVESVGRDVTVLAVGDEVAGMTGMSLGCHAELVAVAGKRLVHKPRGVTHDEAAGVLFGGTTAWHYLATLGGVRPGQSVLVNGASGAIGTNAIQLAKRAGAVVTAVTSAGNASLVTELGADHVVDYAVTPVTTLAERFDVVLDTAATLDLRSGRRLLADAGVLLLAVGSLGDTVRARGNAKAGPAPEDPETFTRLLDLVAEGELTVVNSHVLDLTDIVRAHEIVDSRRKVGNVIVRP